MYTSIFISTLDASLGRDFVSSLSTKANTHFCYAYTLGKVKVILNPLFSRSLGNEVLETYFSRPIFFSLASFPNSVWSQVPNNWGEFSAPPGHLPHQYPWCNVLKKLMFHATTSSIDSTFKHLTAAVTIKQCKPEAFIAFLLYTFFLLKCL